MLIQINHVRARKACRRTQAWHRRGTVRVLAPPAFSFARIRPRKSAEFAMTGLRMRLSRAKVKLAVLQVARADAKAGLM